MADANFNIGKLPKNITLYIKTQDEADTIAETHQILARDGRRFGPLVCTLLKAWVTKTKYNRATQARRKEQI